MSKCNKSLSKEQIVTKNKKNIKCNLSFETNKFNELIDKYIVDSFKIICTIGDTSGYGDIIFFIKFVKYLLAQYDKIKIIIVVSNRKITFVSNILNPYIIHSDNEVKIIPKGNNRLELIVGYIVDNKLCSNYEIDGDILFIVPKTNISINLKYKNLETIKRNSYTLSEYNPMEEHTKSTINTGIGSKKIGMLNNNFPNTINNIKKPFSITYIYLDEQSIYEYYFEPSKINFEIDDNTIWNLETLFKNIKIKLNKKFLKDDYFEDFLISDKYEIVIFIKICLEYRNYLNELTTLTDSQILIYSRGDSVNRIKTFIQKLNKTQINILKLESLHYNLLLNPNFTFEQLPPKSYDEMRVLYEHCLPIVFISGDQSLTDFVTLNKYFIDKYNYGIYYQIFSWKQNLAESLGTNNYICFKITNDVLNNLAYNPTFDFRYRGMLFIHSLLLFALQYKLGLNNICTDLDSKKTVYRLIDEYKIPKFEKLYENYIRNGDINNNLNYVVEFGELIITENSDPFNINMLLGKLKHNNKFTSWLMGTEISDVFLKYTSDSEFEENVFAINCNDLYVTLKNDLNHIPKSVNALLIYLILETIRYERYIDNNLVRTFGSFIILDDDCNTEIKSKLKLNINKPLNTLLVQENVYGKYISLDTYINSNEFDIEIFEKILDNLLFVISVLSMSKYNIVHNNLRCTNVYLIFGTKEQVYIKIINFDEASFKLDKYRFCTYSSKQKEFSKTYDIEYFFKDLENRLSKDYIEQLKNKF